MVWGIASQRRGSACGLGQWVVRMSTAARAWTVRDGVPRFVEARFAPGSAPCGTGRGTALVRVRYAGVCGSDVPKLLPTWRGSLPTPWFPGHEIVGKDARGDWVSVDPLITCHSCGACQSGRTHLCRDLRRVGWDLPGGLAELVQVPESSIVKLPYIRDAAHGILADPMAVALHGIRCGLGARSGRLGVIGAGALGICTAVCAASTGWDVHLAVRSAARHQELQRALAGPRLSVHHRALPSCDAVVDTASGYDDSPLLQAVASVRDGGTVLVQNAYAPNVTLSLPLRDLFRRSVTLRGSFSYCRGSGHDDFRDALAFLTHGGAWADLLTRDRYPLPELPRALAALGRQDHCRPLKVLLTSNT
ncbi:alcohol dehydrogenase catalytic domain-containing protein [Streptomyces sp. NPDC086023]|uniref:alcohol dehydrogenase catalytic domain-containing protein n=1 Tax=Streptomyces sp. NPDC086023 TaxID=3365746 RepID=UPI0037D90CE4